MHGVDHVAAPPDHGHLVQHLHGMSAIRQNIIIHISTTDQDILEGHVEHSGANTNYQE